MLSAEPVSPLFAQLYDTKVRMLRENLGRLDLLLSRHNFFDCQTVLQLQHPETHRKALLLQAEMDVDADGSDSDRLTVGTGAPANFKPATSYRWDKKTDAPNPYLSGTEQRLKRAEDDYAAAGTAPERKRELRNAIAELRNEIGTLKKFSFLIGATDPFIVVPGTFTRGPDPVKWAITRWWFLATRFIQPSLETLVPTTKLARLRCASQRNSTRLQQPTIGR